ncbi:C4-dicarboxylate TRAP transporter substrate-binding protein [Microbaculum marinum]|uniref:C4-dicarboxylate TRAP transporter substrate-binding protein n=1 Tax=Microbaculum marinum TaxID=1764581 RepID=A0AAW9RP35_9HYPH
MRISGVFCRAALLVMATAPMSANAADYTLRLGTVLAPGDPLVVGAEAMKKAVEERTGGKVEVQIFPSSQLGDTQDMMDQAQAGANVGTFVEASRVSVFVPQFNVLVAPYVFDSVNELVDLVDSPTFAAWNKELEEKTGLTLLSFNWYQGARNMLTKKPISTPADLEGVRVRTIGQPLWIETIGAMGAVPTPLAWAEVYPSLQTGVIDGAEAQPSAIWGAKLYEVVSDVTVTEHIYLMSGLLVSAKWLASLPEDLRTIVEEEARKAGAAVLQSNVDQESKIFADIEKEGVKVHKIDTAPFREAVQPVYEKLGLTEMITETKKTMGKQ